MTVANSASGPGSKHPVKIFANIFISFIGAGCLGLPYAFKEAGIIEGMLIMSGVGILSVKAMLMIIACKYKLIEKLSPSSLDYKSKKRKVFENINGRNNQTGELNEEAVDLLKADVLESQSMTRVEDPVVLQAPGQELSYGDIGYHALGPWGKYLVEGAIVISQIGFVCAYLIFILENLTDYITALSKIHWLLILLPPLYLLTLIRHLSSLAVSSLFAQLSALMAFGVVFWFDFDNLNSISIHPKNMKLDGFPFFFAVSIYCYEGAGMILSLESSVTESVRHKFKGFFVVALTLCTILYISFGACGYMSFGRITKQIITLNLPKGDALDFAIMVKSCLCLALFFTYPVMVFPVVKILEVYFIPEAEKAILKGNILRLLLVLTTGVVVLAIPDFTHLMALVGATCCTLLAFILPAIFHMRIFKGQIGRCYLCFDIFLILIGLTAAVICTMDAVKRLFQQPEVISGLGTTVDQMVIRLGENHTMWNTNISSITGLTDDVLNERFH